MNFKLMNKAVFFPETKTLAIGDLHLGYESMLRKQGIVFPFNQLEQSKKDVQNIIKILEKNKHKVKKIILLGDIKHQFGFDIGEKFEVRDFLNFLERYVDQKNIILLKGNHEKFALDKRRYRNFYIQSDTAFIHGDKSFPKILDKKIKTIVMGHLHPAVFLKDKKGIKKEKFKCFLTGKWKNKKVIILPSFFPLVEGSGLNEGFQNRENFSIIPKRSLQKFNVHILGKDKIYGFGELKDLG